MNKDDCPYDILGVEEDSSDADIKKAYRKLALKHHPDKQHTPEDKEAANDVFCKLSQAYETLSDPVKKYDYRLANGKKEKKATKVTKTETDTSTNSTSNSTSSGSTSSPNVKTTTETSYEPPKPKPQTNYSSPSPTASTPNQSNSWSKVQPNNTTSSGPKVKKQPNKFNSNSSNHTAETDPSSSSTETDTSYSYTAPPKKKSMPPPPNRPPANRRASTGTGYSYIPPPGKAENMNANPTAPGTPLFKKKMPVKKVPLSSPVPKKKVPVTKVPNTSYSYVPPPGKSTEHTAAAAPKKVPVQKVDSSYNYVPPPHKATETFASPVKKKQPPSKKQVPAPKPPPTRTGSPTSTSWSRASHKDTPTPPRKTTIPPPRKNMTKKKTVPPPKKTIGKTTTTTPKKPIIHKGETEYVWTRDTPNVMATITGVNKKPTAPLLRNHKNNPQFHDPFQIFDNVMMDEYGDDYQKSSSPSGWSDPSTFSKANHKMEPKKKKGGVLGFFSGKSKPNEVVSMTMSTKTLQHDDGRMELKTITKIKRVDGSVERVVQSSLVDDTTTVSVPSNTSAEMHKSLSTPPNRVPLKQ